VRLIASNQGNATATPMPRSSVRREIRLVLIGQSFLLEARF
jgi:hypothetical protein